MNLLRNFSNGMTILGQGGRILLGLAPFLFLAIVLVWLYPELVAMPANWTGLRICGLILLAPGFVLWGFGVVQLLQGFPRGRLITTGAYGLCRNPIYTSMAVLILPAVSLIFSTWIFIAVSAILLVLVNLLIGPEEVKLGLVFGSAYRDYCARVGRFGPRFGKLKDRTPTWP
ncbi:MAG: hypothetical protein KKI09_15220 [Spirochaetes bacterium]|nr:hypothetical protein [Spirochaetota bacterium]MBU0956776.1 hypothetical protein [Spirochaetota bacterium]